MNQEESYIHGMLAFPLLELGRMEEAAAASRKGYEINKEDAWAHHFVSTSDNVILCYHSVALYLSCTFCVCCSCVMFFNMNVSLKKQWSSWKNSQNLGNLAHPSCKPFS